MILWLNCAGHRSAVDASPCIISCLVDGCCFDLVEYTHESGQWHHRLFTLTYFPLWSFWKRVQCSHTPRRVTMWLTCQTVVIHPLCHATFYSPDSLLVQCQIVLMWKLHIFVTEEQHAEKDSMALSTQLCLLCVCKSPLYIPLCCSGPRLCGSCEWDVFTFIVIFGSWRSSHRCSIRNNSVAGSVQMLKDVVIICSVPKSCVKEELQTGRTRAGGHKHSWAVCWCHGWTVNCNFAVLDLKCFNVHLFSSFSRYDYHFICLTKVMLLNVHTSPTAGFQSMTRKPGGFRGRRVNAISFIYHCRWLWWEQSKTTCRRSTRRSWEPSRLTCMRVLCPWWPSWSEPEEEPKRERATIRMPDDPADHFTL